MLKVSMLALGASLMIGAAMPGDAAAQLSGRAQSEAAKRGGVIVPQTDRRDDRRDDRCYDDRYDDRRGKNKKNDRDRDNDRRWDNCDDDRRDGRYDDRNRNGNGPKFCQNGQGHPVHGRAWCRQKGWDNASLRNTGWGDVILRRPRYEQSSLGRSVLEQILGRTVYNRFDGQRSRLGLSSNMTGQWRNTSNGTVLDLFASGIQIAQLIDRNRDGRADVVLMNYGR
jgi:hypothetical protein